MTTTNAKDFKHLAKARISSEKIEGILYLDKDGYWYIFHNGDFHDGATPAEFERVRGIYKKSWYLCHKDSISELEIELVDYKKEARKAARKKTIVDSDDYGYLEDSEEPEKISDVSRFISGANVTFYKKLYGSSYSSSTGQLYYSGEGKRWYFISNNPDFNGDKPSEWSELKEKGEFKYSFVITTSGKNKLHYEESYITFSPVVREPEPEPVKEDEQVSINYSSLEEGSEVLFSIKDYKPVRKLPTRGKLYKNPDSGVWFILHNDENKSGGTPPTPLSEIFGGEFSRSWNIGNSSDPYRKLIRFEILSRPKEKIADVPKDRFAIDSMIHCLTPGQFKDKLGRAGFAHSGLFERYAGTKARVVRVKSEREIVVRWYDNIEYGMDKNEFQEFYPEYHGREISVDVKIPEKTIAEPGTYATSKPDFTPRFDVGRILTCLTPEHFKSRLGREKFFFGGDFEKLAGTRCKVKHIISTSSIMVEWLDVPIHDFTMNVNEFQDYYSDLRETIDLRKSFADSGKFTTDIVLPCSGGMCTLKDIKFDKFHVPDHASDHIDAFAYSMHVKDKFKPDASYEYTPPVHPSSSKLRPTSDSDIKGDSVPRKKNIDTLLILGL